jgi:hypothetical protein
MRRKLAGEERHDFRNNHQVVVRRPSAALFFGCAYWTLALVGCGDPLQRAEFQTRCGMWTNEDVSVLQKAETALVRGFEIAQEEMQVSVVDDVCPLLERWYIRINPISDGNGWHSERHGYRIAGQTDCGLSVIDVAHWDFQWNAYAHEAVHLVERCSLESYNHTGWDSGWQNRVIVASQKAFDP